MDMIYRSTRNESETATASEAILKGLTSDGGLFVPDELPELDVPFEELAEMDYQGVAFEVMSRMFTDFTEDELIACIEGAYDVKFDTEKIAPVKYHHGAYILELFHGKTIAFKDMALSILPYLMTTAAKKNNINDEILILTATSGDTGKAALAGFADVPGTNIIVYYPKGGVSPIQEAQMLTSKGANLDVVSVKGNFDDAQTGVKKIFSDPKMQEFAKEHGVMFSSANSINIGRLVPQIVYYVYAYTRLVAAGTIKPGDEINVVVPTGNFGNILAAYYASLMGLPVKKFICASNDNKVLFDFFTTGKYDKNRDFILTTSPSMDILISSNLERLIYRIAGNDATKNAEMMKSLNEKGEYEIDEEMKKNLYQFYGNFATMDEVAETIKTVYEEDGYVLDPHTAVAVNVYDKYKAETGDDTPVVIASTASPYKFTRSVVEAIVGEKRDKASDFELVDELFKISGVAIPQAIEDARSGEPMEKRTFAKTKMSDPVKEMIEKINKGL